MNRLAPLVLIVVLSLVAAGCASAEEEPADATTSADPAAGSSAVATATPPAESGGAEDVAVGGMRIDTGAGEALVWGEGSYGVLLAHGAAFDAASWTDQALEIAALGTTVLALEDISAEGITAGVAYLQEEVGVDEVALVGGSAGADAILRLLGDQPDLPDQLITLSANSAVEGLGEYPKLFIASEEESVADASTTMAEAGFGPDDEALILPGSAHAQNLFDSEQSDAVLEAMLQRIQEFGTS